MIVPKVKGFPDLVLNASDITYSYKGAQLKRRLAKGSNASSIGSLTIPSLDLNIEGIKSKVITRSRRNGDPKSVVRFSVAKITYQGSEIAIPTPGKPVTIDGLGILESRLVDNNRWGKRVTALRVTLTDYSAVLDLGISASQVFRY